MIDHDHEVEQVLTRRERMFVNAYFECLTTKEAAILIGYSPASADHAAWKMMQRPNVLAAIEKRKIERNLRSAVTADIVVNEIAKRAFTGMSNFLHVHDDGTVEIDLASATKAQLDCITEITQDAVIDPDTGKKKIKTKIKLDQGKYLELLGRHFALFTDKLKVEVDLSALTDEEILQARRLKAKMEGEKIIEGEIVESLPVRHEEATAPVSESVADDVF